MIFLLPPMGIFNILLEIPNNPTKPKIYTYAWIGFALIFHYEHHSYGKD
jgi:hypothetical protein